MLNTNQNQTINANRRAKPDAKVALANKQESKQREKGDRHDRKMASTRALPAAKLRNSHYK